MHIKKNATAISMFGRGNSTLTRMTLIAVVLTILFVIVQYFQQMPTKENEWKNIQEQIQVCIQKNTPQACDGINPMIDKFNWKWQSQKAHISSQ
mgnify:CR=1 FL=1